MNNYERVAKSYLSWAPFSLAIREVSRLKVLTLLDHTIGILKEDSILDVGCGDGHWWSHLLPHELHKIHGIDISSNEINLANNTISAQCLDVTSSTFIDDIKIKKFGLVIGNCSLEHIFEIEKALRNVHSVLRSNGTFVIFVPTPDWALKGKFVGVLKKLSPRLLMAFSGLINGFFQHWHLYNHTVWSSVLKNNGFRVKAVHGFGNKKSEFLFRLGLPSAFISFTIKVFTGKYLNYFLSPIIPASLQNFVAEKINLSLDSSLLGPESPDIFEYVIVCEKDE